VLGENDAGKITLLEMVSGTMDRDPCDCGMVLIDRLTAFYEDLEAANTEHLFRVAQ